MMDKKSLQKDKRKIRSPWLLAVEGKDECNFFEAMLNHMGIEGIQLLDIGGKDKFKDAFDLLYSSSEFPDIRAIGLIRDAEDKKADSAFSSIRSILKKYPPLPVPNAPNTVIDGKNNQGKDFRIGIFIMPNNADRGMLEDLCLQSVRQEPAFVCVDQYMDCCLSKLLEGDAPPQSCQGKGTDLPCRPEGDRHFTGSWRQSGLLGLRARLL